MDWSYLFTRFEGRVGRQSYWIGVGIMIVAGLVIGGAIGLMAGLTGSLTVVAVAGLLVQLLFLYPSAALMYKRFQDRGRPGTMAWLLLGPLLLQSVTNLMGLTGDPFASSVLDWIFAAYLLIVGVWFLVELGFLRGTAGTNPYGADPVAS